MTARMQQIEIGVRVEGVYMGLETYTGEVIDVWPTGFGSVSVLVRLDTPTEILGAERRHIMDWINPDGSLDDDSEMRVVA